MKNNFEAIRYILKKELSILWIFSVLLGIALIALQAKNKLPLGQGDFVFISILALCVALYRPRWVFFLFVALVPIENIILVSGFLPMQLRPYQFTAAILAVAIAILLISKRLSFKLLKPTWLDWLVFSLVPLSFLSLINSPEGRIGLKNNLILISFVLIYYILRNFVRSREDFAKTMIFFIGSNFVVAIYGFFQVYADKFGFRSYEVMFGRPNSTFTEPDWLGIFLCFSLAVLLSAIYFLERNLEKYTVYFLIFLNLTLLILTLSRSAWIGATLVIFFWLMFSLYKKGEVRTIFTPKIFAHNFLVIFLISLLAFLVIQFGKLSRFDISDRARSAATSEQKITIACDNNQNIPKAVTNIDELSKFGCQHIDLEKIEYYKSLGEIVSEIFRDDPNVLTRKQIYYETFQALTRNKTSATIGIGFGATAQLLGSDNRGTELNESNIFLQIWAGSGIFGLAVFSAGILYLLIYSFRRISPVCPLNKIIGCPFVRDDIERILNVFIVLGLLALIIPNSFNAGLLMGLFWLGIGILVSTVKLKEY